jgi:hypothetical protein
MAPGWSRPCANKGVPSQAYHDAVKDWLSKPPVCSVELKCGPKLAHHFRNITPAMIIAALPLLQSLLAAGLDTMVVQIGKLEWGLATYLSANRICQGDAPCLDTLVHNIATHLQCVMTVVRNIKREDDKPMLGGYRRFPKSGGIRKRMTADEWHALVPVLASMTACPQALG